MLDNLNDIVHRKWVQVTLLTVVGSFAYVVISLALQSAVSGGASADTFQRGMLSAFMLPLMFIAPLLALLGLTLNENFTLKQKYARGFAHDSLTSCLNGALFAAAIDVFRPRTGPRKGALLVIDIDHMRRINEHIGYSAGNHALREIAEIIRASVRSGDLVGRIGGDEFGVYLAGATRENAEKVAERIRLAVAEAPFEPSGSNWHVTVSVGAVLFETETTVDNLLVTADHQMQLAKERGRNRIEYTMLDHGSSPSRPSLH